MCLGLTYGLSEMSSRPQIDLRISCAVLSVSSDPSIVALWNIRQFSASCFFFLATSIFFGLFFHFHS